MSAAANNCPAHLDMALELARAKERAEAMSDLVTELRGEMKELRAEVRELSDEIRKLTNLGEVKVAREKAKGDYLVAKVTGITGVLIALVEGVKAWFGK